ncbi:MAG: hypothetical protein ACI82A_002322, partial [Candidatus Azotimanducaceae bacterium]
MADVKPSGSIELNQYANGHGITGLFGGLKEDPETRIVVMQGAGRAFC